MPLRIDLRTAASVAAAISVVCAGCGSSHPSHASVQFQQQAQRVCDEARAAIKALPRGGTVALVGRYTRKADRILQRERARFATLTAPPADRPHVTSLLAAWDRTLAATRHVITGSDDARIAFGLRAVHRAKLDADAAARSAGIPRCQGFSPFEPGVPSS